MPSFCFGKSSALQSMLYVNKQYSGISVKWTPLVQKSVRFTQIFSKIVWPQSKAIRSSFYCPSGEGVHFIVCPLYTDSTVLCEIAC